MRKNSPRKWLHAVLDLLPVILIPVFMIYSHRHDVTETTTINYKYESNEVNTLDDLVEGNIYNLNINQLGIDDILQNGGLFQLRLLSDLELDSLDQLDMQEYITPLYFAPYTYLEFYYDDVLTISVFYDYETLQNGDYYLYFEYGGTFSNSFIFELIHIDDVNTGFLDKFTYTDYNVIESVDIENTDVMDSFMNHFNTTIDNHFNMGNVFNLTGVYDWFNTNIFNGNAPQIIYSVWNIALYELVMDLLFLLYGLFMWFIDMVQHLMDKPFKSIK